MKPPSGSATRREFFSTSAMLLASGMASAGMASDGSVLFRGNPAVSDGDSFAAYQERRRKELWGLLGDLPWEHTPSPPKLVTTEEHGDYTLERWVLDLNGIEPVPALLLIPHKRQNPAPGML
jgi:hypothetical protein